MAVGISKEAVDLIAVRFDAVADSTASHPGNLAKHLAKQPREVAATLCALSSEIARLTAELADANSSVVAFGAIWAVQYAKDFGLPEGCLHAKHYDILEKAGTRMDSFSRAKDMEAGNGLEA